MIWGTHTKKNKYRMKMPGEQWPKLHKNWLHSQETMTRKSCFMSFINSGHIKVHTQVFVCVCLIFHFKKNAQKIYSFKNSWYSEMKRRIKRSKSSCDKNKFRLLSHMPLTWLIALASVFGYIISSQGMPFDPWLEEKCL